jgi:hypothetical protein
LFLEHEKALNLQNKMIEWSVPGRAANRKKEIQKFSKEARSDVRLGAHPHVPLVAAGCAQAIRLFGRMAAFDRGEIGNFEFEAITRRINEIYQSCRTDFKTTALIRARFRLLLPCQSLPLQNEITLLFLKIELTYFSTIRDNIVNSGTSGKHKKREGHKSSGWRLTLLKIIPPCFIRNPSHFTRSPADAAHDALPSLAISRTLEESNAPQIFPCSLPFAARGRQEDGDLAGAPTPVALRRRQSCLLGGVHNGWLEGGVGSMKIQVKNGFRFRKGVQVESER